MIDHRLNGTNKTNQPIVKLVTRYHPTGRFQIKVNGRWRQSKQYDYFCFYCFYQSGVNAFVYCQKGNHTPLEYYGYQDRDEVWVFWGVCTTCQCRVTDFFWRGKPKEQRPTGGNEHGWLRARRQSSGY